MTEEVRELSRLNYIYTHRSHQVEASPGNRQLQHLSTKGWRICVLRFNHPACTPKKSTAAHIDGQGRAVAVIRRQEV